MDLINPNRLIKLIFRICPVAIWVRIYKYFPSFYFIKETKDTQTPITFLKWYDQKILGKNDGPYWPVHPTSTVGGWQNIYCGIETSPGYSFGNYISAHVGTIYIGDYTQIAPNVGIISQNHSLTDNRKYEAKDVKIGNYCWIGMGAIILPGVHLGDYTIVAAGAIVSKSFHDGFCVIAGNPAKIIKNLNPSECVFHKSDFEYNGYIKAKDFEDFRKSNLNI